jgi:hypothetical protein
MANATPTSKDAIMKVGARQCTLSSSEGLCAKARALVNAIEMAVTVVRLKKWYAVRKEVKQEDEQPLLFMQGILLSPQNVAYCMVLTRSGITGTSRYSLESSAFGMHRRSLHPLCYGNTKCII